MILEIAQLDCIVHTTEEPWMERYYESLRKEGSAVNPFVTLHEGILMTVDSGFEHTTVESFTDEPEFAEYWQQVEATGIRLQTGRVDRLHITEAASNTKIGQGLLRAADKGGAHVILIPEDLAEGMDVGIQNTTEQGQ